LYRGDLLNSSLSILHVVAPGEVGGLESVVRLLAAGQRGAGHRVRVAAILDGAETAGSFRAHLHEADVDVIPLVLPGRSYLRERASIGRLCRQGRPDVVHTHGYRPDIIDAGVARALGIPTVTTVHGFTGGGFRNRCYEWVQQRSFRDFDAVVAVSDPLSVQLEASGVSPGRLHLVPNAYRAGPPCSRADARRLLGIPSEAFVAGWVGRLTREKGADVLVDALGRPGMPPELHVAVLGDGAERAELEARARALAVEQRLVWHGLYREAARVYSAFDVFVLSSRTEGTPIALFEAMAAGVPIVATRVGGVPHVVSATEALLVPSESPDALADAIRAIRDDPAGASRRALAAAARLRSEFGVGPWLDRYDAVYRRLLPTPSVRHTA
jgi:glycosyltransferase involved in cell wall biosynthesis